MESLFYLTQVFLQNAKYISEQMRILYRQK